MTPSWLHVEISLYGLFLVLHDWLWASIYCCVMGFVGLLSNHTLVC
jgi:hypothetical protein